MKHGSIRDISKRFQIVFYHLEKIIEDWGSCRGLSYNDTTEIGELLRNLQKLYSERTFESFEEHPYISEEEFDNEPYATMELQAKNEDLERELEFYKGMMVNVQKQLISRRE